VKGLPKRAQGHAGGGRDVWGDERADALGLPGGVHRKDPPGALGGKDRNPWKIQAAEELKRLQYGRTA